MLFCSCITKTEVEKQFQNVYTVLMWIEKSVIYLSINVQKKNVWLHKSVHRMPEHPKLLPFT